MVPDVGEDARCAPNGMKPNAATSEVPRPEGSPLGGLGNWGISSHFEMNSKEKK